MLGVYTSHNERCINSGQKINFIAQDLVNIYSQREHYFDPNLVQGPLGKAQVEAFLDDHPDFMESYVLRKVDRFVEI